MKLGTFPTCKVSLKENNLYFGVARRLRTTAVTYYPCGAEFKLHFFLEFGLTPCLKIHSTECRNYMIQL
jgi:hypothetical protein